MKTRLIQLLGICDVHNSHGKYHFEGMGLDRLGNAIRAGEIRREEARRKACSSAPFTKEEWKEVVDISRDIEGKWYAI